MLRFCCWCSRCSSRRVPCIIYGRNGGYPSRIKSLDGLSWVRTRSPPTPRSSTPRLTTLHPARRGTWLLTGSASLFPFVYPIKHQTPHSKILSYFLAFSACFVILSISVEGLFFLSYSALLVVWVEVEVAIRPSPSETTTVTTVVWYQPRADDLRIALFFLFFVQVAFFGTGNVASIS